MKLNWIVSRDNKKAVLNGGELEVEIKEIDLRIHEPRMQTITNNLKVACGFTKIDSGKSYECKIIKNNLLRKHDKLNGEISAQFISKLFSSLGDIYNE